MSMDFDPHCVLKTPIFTDNTLFQRGKMSKVSQKISELPPHVEKLIERLISAAKANNVDSFLTGHWLMNKELYSLFGLKLAMYHVVTKSPVNKYAFENVLAESCLEVGISAELPKSATADVDVVLAGKRTSLKSEGKIHDNIHISKFCELGWGPWAKPEDLFYKINKKNKTDSNRTFEIRIDQYDAILSLRHDDTEKDCIKYELVEIPIDAFRRVLSIPLQEYKREMSASSSKTNPKSFNIRTSWSGKKTDRDIVVKFDGGGERKLTITLPKEAATVVATWSFNLKV